MSQILVTGEAKIRDIQGPVVANSGVITALDGAASQYVRGDGTLADFPTSSGGGSSVSYYLNSSVSQGTIGGVAYRELSKEPIIGAGTDIAISSNGYVANYITDANDPDVVLIPGGNFNCEFYFSVNNNTGNPFFYAELYKYDGTTFTLLGSSVGVPEYITQGTTIAPYYFAIPVATATLALTDRLAIRIYVNVSGRTVTLHTENGHLCQVVTTLSKGMVSLNNLTDQSQFLAVGTSGTNFNIVSSGDTHTFNIPDASPTARGLITTSTQNIAGSKTFNDAIGANYGIALYNGAIPPITSIYYAALSGNSTGLSITYRTGGGTNYTNNLNFPANNNSYAFPTTGGTLALTSDISYPVTSVFGRTGAVVAASGDYTTTQVTEGTNLYYTDSRSRAAISLTTTGTSGAATYNSTTGVLNIPQYTDQFVGTVTSVAALTIGTTGTNITSSVANSTTTPVITLNIPNSSATNRGALTAADWITFSNKQDALNGTGFVKAIGTDVFYDNTSYLPLTGGTLTGTLNGTSATFSGNMAIGSSTTALSPLQVVATGTIVRLGQQSGTTGKQFLIGIDATSGRSELQSVWQGTGFTSLALQPSGGNVLIGTTGDNGARLQVSGTATFSGSVTAESVGFIGVIAAYSSNFISFSHTSRSGAGDYSFLSASDGFTIINGKAGAGVELRINNATKVSVASNGTTTFTGPVLGTAISWTDAANNTGYLSIRGAAAAIGADNNLVFETAATERMRITSGGAVLMGTTTDNNYRLGVEAAAGGAQIYLTRSGANAQMFMGGTTGAGTQFYISANNSGGVYLPAGGVAWISASDERLKTDLLPIEDAANKVSSLRSVIGRYKTDAKGTKRAFLIAQDVVKVLPEAVNKNVENGDLGVSYTEVIPLLVAAIKELEARIKQLENK